MYSAKNRIFLTIWIALLAFAFICFWHPGVLLFDVVSIVSQFMSGRYGDWLSPTVSVIWGSLAYLDFGLASILVFHVSIFSISLLFLLIALETRLALACLISFFVFVSPCVFFSLSLITRDATFAVFLFLSSSLLLTSSLQKKSHLLELLSFGSLAIAVFSRQEGIIVCFPILLWYLTYRNSQSTNKSAYSLFLAVFLLALMCLSEFVVYRGLLKVFPTNPERYFLVRDLTMISRATDKCHVCELRNEKCSEKDLEALIASPWHRSMPWYEWHDRVRSCLDESNVEQIYEVWAKAVFSHPLLLAQKRLHGMHRMLKRPLSLTRYFEQDRKDLNDIYASQDLSALPESFLLRSSLRLEHWQTRILETILWGGNETLVSAYPYLLIHCLLFFLLLAKMRKCQDKILLSFAMALTVSALLHSAVLLLIGAGGAYRNYTWLCLSSLLSLFIYVLACARFSPRAVS